MATADEDGRLAAQLADPAMPLNEYGAIRRLMICPAETAYGGQPRLDAAWQGEEFLGRPDFAEALLEYDRFAQVLADSGADCLAQTGHGIDTLRSPEPGFFLLGSKSYGRNNTFLLQVGYEQVSDVFADLPARVPAGETAE